VVLALLRAVVAVEVAAIQRQALLAARVVVVKQLFGGFYNESARY
jgi:hypothetical protein